MIELIRRLRRERSLSPDEFRVLLSEYDETDLKAINREAKEVAQHVFGNKIYIRGLIEIGNRCRNDCYYCGIRRSNRHVERYRLNNDTILECCRQGYALGFQTFVLQGGEENEAADEEMTILIKNIRMEFPDVAVTLSLGEKSPMSYKRFFQAGASRYLLRHETHNSAHYHFLHPESMSLANRLHCLNNLKSIGFQTGTGIMVGSPGQTVDNLVEDILFISEFRPQMIGIGPFLPHRDTPFAQYPPGSMEQTLLLLSIFRLMHPHALIPSTTALATLSPDGRERGILAGANVVMPNLSPMNERGKYSLYDNKAFTGAEAAEGLHQLRRSLEKIGYEIDYGRGDYSAPNEYN